MKILTLILSLTFATVSAQSYRNFLEHDSTQLNSFLTASVNFMYSQDGKSGPGGKGYTVSAGLNLARLISKKIILGVSIDLKIVNGLWGYGYSPSYQTDFKNSFKINSLNPADSGRANLMYDLVMTGKDINTQYGYGLGHRGSSFYEYGIEFSPYPNCYGGFMVKIERGHYNYRIGSVYGNKYVQGGQVDDTFITAEVQNRIELSFKPLSFFRTTNIIYSMDSDYKRHQRERKLWWLDALLVSIYYERLSYQNTDIEGYKLTNFLSPAFMSKYGIDEYFGLKIGYGIY